jgi:hypothetical protein
MSCPPDPPHLPDQTSDDLDVGWGDDRDEDDGSRLLDDLPPHHLDRD